MALLAKRVRAKRELLKITSTSSAVEKRRIRSKMSAAFSLVSISDFPWRRGLLRLPFAACKTGLAPSLRIGRAYANISEARGAGAVSGTDNLLGLAFAAIRSSPQRPLV